MTASPARGAVRRRLTVALVSGVLAITAGAFALANSATVTPPGITPAAGLASNGQVASVDTSIASAITTSNGSAQLDSGVVLSAIDVAPSYAAKLRIEIDWTDPYDAAKALKTPNAQISVGLYYPIHQGSCVNSDKSETNAWVDVVDGSYNYCSELDGSVTGSSNVGTNGKLFLAKNLPSGYMLSTKADNGSLATCTTFTGTASTESTLPWCQPEGVSTTGVIFVAASILTPGGIPPGQQATLTSLSFFVQATAR